MEYKVLFVFYLMHTANVKLFVNDATQSTCVLNKLISIFVV